MQGPAGVTGFPASNPDQSGPYILLLCTKKIWLKMLNTLECFLPFPLCSHQEELCSNQENRIYIVQMACSDLLNAFSY